MIAAILAIWGSARRVIPSSIDAKMVWNPIVVESTIVMIYQIQEWLVDASACRIVV